jgi:hypothetical protein
VRHDPRLVAADEDLEEILLPREDPDDEVGVAGVRIRDGHVESARRAGRVWRLGYNP